MVKDRSRLTLGAFLFVFFAYALFLAFDFQVRTRNVASLVLPRISNESIPDLRGVILGGSNAVVGISAEQLSVATRISWFNAAVSSESGSELGYDGVIVDAFSGFDRTKISYVVYSGIRLLSPENSLSYSPPLSLLPSRSINSYLRAIIFPTIDRTRPFNDLMDSFSQRCNANCRSEFNATNIDEAAAFLYRRILFVANLFPRAELIILLPSRLYSGGVADGVISSEAKRLVEALGAMLDSANLKVYPRVRVILQPPFPNEEFVSDHSHANVIGRYWRTCHLLAVAFRQEAGDCSRHAFEGSEFGLIEHLGGGQ
jgi:hypothetical protein